MTAAKRGLFLDRLLAHQGAPYVWAGKGWDVWTPEGLTPHQFGVEVFDCVGLVTTALWQAGGPDWRATHNAQTVFNACSPVALPGRPLNLLFYGTHDNDVQHIAVVLGCSACGGELRTKLEAAGGNHLTTKPAFPLGNARVMVRRENRIDFLAERSLPPSALEPAV